MALLFLVFLWGLFQDSFIIYKSIIYIQLEKGLDLSENHLSINTTPKFTLLMWSKPFPIRSKITLRNNFGFETFYWFVDTDIKLWTYPNFIWISFLHQDEFFWTIVLSGFRKFWVLVTEASQLLKFLFLR